MMTFVSKLFLFMLLTAACVLMPEHDHVHAGSPPSLFHGTETFYDVLGISQSATKAEIRSAYRKLAREMHPDKHPESQKKQYEEKFIAIVKAYEVLSDEAMRRKYDASSQQSAELYDHSVDDFGSAWAAYQSHGVEDTPRAQALVVDHTLLSLAVHCSTC